MYTHSLDKNPELEKLFNMYAKKSEVIILCAGSNLLQNIFVHLCYRLTLK